MSASRHAAWRSRFSSVLSSMPDDDMKRSVHSINSSPCCGERERSRLSSRAAAISASCLRSSLLRNENSKPSRTPSAENTISMGFARSMMRSSTRGRVRKQRTAAGCHGLDLRQRVGVHATDKPREFQRFLRLDDIAVHHMQRVPGLRHVQSRKRTPGAADRVEGSALATPQERHFGKRVLDQLLGLLDRTRRTVLQREAAERQRGPGFQAMTMHVDQFERTTAEVADDAVGAVEARYHTKRGQFRLARTGDHVDLGAADLLRGGDEFAAIFGVAACRRRQHPQLLDPHRVAERAETLERLQRLLNGVRGHQTLGLHLAAETGHGFFVEQRRRTARHALVHDETDRVRTDIDDANRRAVVEAALRYFSSGTSLKHALTGE